MATVKAVLNKDRKKKGGGYSLVIQILHKRSKRVIYTPYVLVDEEFDVEGQQVLHIENSRFTKKQIREINRYVEHQKEAIRKFIALVNSQKVDFEAKDVIREYYQEQGNRYLATFIEHLIEKKEKAGKFGMAKALRSTLRSLNKFIGNREVLFSDITSTFVKEYQDYLAGTDIKQNSINFYLRNFRAIYNLALETSVNMIDYAPFKKIHIRNEKTDKRALKKETIERISKLNLLHNSELDKARDLFMFSFYTRGMCFVDIVYLKRANIIDGVICYKRQKTHQSMQVEIIPELQAIIDKYHSDDEYVLPFINSGDQPTLYKKYQYAYHNLHRNLKKLQKELKLTTPLTMHVARHSWATLARESGIQVSIISQGLGHTSEKTTEIYLKDFDNSVINAANVKVVQFSMCNSAKYQKKSLPLQVTKW